MRIEYQKSINLLNSTNNQPSKFITKKWVELNGDARGICNTSSQIKFKTTMLISSLCDYSDADIFVMGTITIKWAEENEDERHAGERNKQVTFKSRAPFTDRLCVIIMSRTRFRVNLHSIFSWILRNSLVETDAISEV